MQKLHKKIVLWLMRTRLYSWLIKHVIPYIRFTTYYPSLRGDKYHEAYSLLRPGHFILTTDKKKLTSMIVPGTFAHAAYVVSKGPKYLLEPRLGTIDVHTPHPHEIVEMTHNNYTKSWFFDICKESDRVAIFTCLDWDDDHKARMIAVAKEFEGVSYDIHFTLGVESLYCSELIYQADLLASTNMMKFLDPSKSHTPLLQVSLADLAGLGRPYISPDGLAKGANVKCVYDSAGELTGLMGADIRRVLGKAR